MQFSALRSSRRSVIALLAIVTVLVAAAAYPNSLDPASRRQAQLLAVQSLEGADSSASVINPRVVTSAAAPSVSASPSDAMGTSRRRFDLTLLLRIGVAAMLAFAVGWEREFRGSAAGDRTFALVSLGAAAFTAVGVENFPATAEKVMAGVVTGVGFLGGGMILQDRGGVRGLTTAAAIWATAAIGMLAGVGELLVATAVSALIILILELPFLPIIGVLDARRWRGTGAHQDEPDSDR